MTDEENPPALIPQERMLKGIELDLEKRAMTGWDHRMIALDLGYRPEAFEAEVARNDKWQWALETGRNQFRIEIWTRLKDLAFGGNHDALLLLFSRLYLGMDDEVLNQATQAAMTSLFKKGSKEAKEKMLEFLLSGPEA